jgi:excisionase family DNA binding protein
MAGWVVGFALGKEGGLKNMQQHESEEPVYERLLTVEEVAELTGLAKGSIYHFISAKRIPVIRLSRRCVRFRKSDLQAWFDTMADPASPVR